MTSTPPRLDDSPAVSRGPDARADRRWGLVALVTGLLGFYGAATLVYISLLAMKKWTRVLTVRGR